MLGWVLNGEIPKGPTPPLLPPPAFARHILIAPQSVHCFSVQHMDFVWGQGLWREHHRSISLFSQNSLYRISLAMVFQLRPYSFVTLNSSLQWGSLYRGATVSKIIKIIPMVVFFPLSTWRNPQLHWIHYFPSLVQQLSEPGKHIRLIASRFATLNS
jgi:hypothetical protein